MKRYKWLVFLMLFQLIISNGMPKIAKAEEASAPIWPESPTINAPGAVVMEVSTGTLIYEKQPYETFYPASTTKLMTSLLAIEQCPLSDIITCSYASIHDIGWDSSRIGLGVGEQISMEDALYAILLASANEVCAAVAEHIGGQKENFVKMMNDRATDLGCVNTHFMNPHGLDDPEHYSCPYDLALIAKKAIEYTTFRRVSGSYYHQIPATNLNVARDIGNTHLIIRKRISYSGVFAGKTGHTSLAGTSLVTCAERNGLTLICVVMGESVSDDAYTDTIALLNYAFQNFHLYDVSSSGINTKNAFPTLFQDEDAVTAEVSSPLSISNSTLVLPNNSSYEDVTKKFFMNDTDSFSVGDNIIGQVDYFYSDKYVGSGKIIYNSPIDVQLTVSTNNITVSETPTSETSTSDASTALPPSSLTPQASELADLRPLIIATLVALLTFAIGGIIIFRPRRRNHSSRNHRRRSY